VSSFVCSSCSLSSSFALLCSLKLILLVFFVILLFLFPFVLLLLLFYSFIPTIGPRRCSKIKTCTRKC
jgi:hypothetical protein